jgi:hypothetical protein
MVVLSRSEPFHRPCIHPHQQISYMISPVATVALSAIEDRVLSRW